MNNRINTSFQSIFITKRIFPVLAVINKSINLYVYIICKPTTKASHLSRYVVSPSIVSLLINKQLFNSPSYHYLSTNSYLTFHRSITWAGKQNQQQQNHTHAHTHKTRFYHCSNKFSIEIMQTYASPCPNAIAQSPGSHCIVCYSVKGKSSKRNRR